MMTLEDVIRALFPAGYTDYDTYVSGNTQDFYRQSPNYQKPPCRAVDLFAVAAVLLQRSGAYHHVVPDIPGTNLRRTISVTTAQRQQWVDAGAAWRGDGQPQLPPPPPAVVDAWDKIWASRHLDLYRQVSPGDPPIDWWQSALALMCIADEASRDLGFEITGRPKSAQALTVEIPYREEVDREGFSRYTFSAANPDLVCVLPKSRAPRVGCTLRSLSHYLALLPPRGLARARWVLAPDLPPEIAGAHDAVGPMGARPFNMLLVPFPYRVSASAFNAIPSEESHWGWFEVQSHWCPQSEGSTDDQFEDLLNYVDELIRAAREDCKEVHALVFPEAALSFKAFDLLIDRLGTQTEIELVVAGLFDQQIGEGEYRHGNFAAMASFMPGREREQRAEVVSAREKHHRWRLDRAQIQTYALGSSLDPNRGWWERIDILNRCLDVVVLRRTATVTALICEDLARHDPCQDLVRGIGPNLVIALLMDGAQLKQRWPARYATVLAEDPGSSVLTLTSLGMVQRANETGQLGLSRKIGLWRDDRGEVMELELAPGTHALMITLQPTQYTEHTLDGRSDENDSQSWRLSGVRPVVLTNADAFAAILT